MMRTERGLVHAAWTSITLIAAIGHAAAASRTLGVIRLPDPDGGGASGVELEDLGGELGTGAEAATQRAVDLDSVHGFLLGLMDERVG